MAGIVSESVTEVSGEYSLLGRYQRSVAQSLALTWMGNFFLSVQMKLFLIPVSQIQDVSNLEVWVLVADRDPGTSLGDRTCPHPSITYSP